MKFSRNYLKVAIYTSKEFDPFFIREILFLIASLYMVLSYLEDPFLNAGNFNPMYVESSIMDFFVIIFSSISSGIFAKKIQNGQLGMIFLSSIPRRGYIVLSLVNSSLWFCLLLITPILLTQYFIYNRILPELCLLFLFMMLSSSVLYTSFGMLFGTITRSQSITTFSVLSIFLVLQLYGFELFPKNALGEYLLMGFGQISNFNNNIQTYLIGGSIYFILAIAFTLPIYRLSIKIGLKSGRS